MRHSGCCEKRVRSAGDQSAPVSVTASGPRAGCASRPSQPQKPMTVRVGRTLLAAGPGHRYVPPPHEEGSIYGRRAAQPVSSQRRWCGSAIVSKPAPGASNDEQQPRGPGACQGRCRPTRRTLHSGRSAMSHTTAGKQSDIARAPSWQKLSAAQSAARREARRARAGFRGLDFREVKSSRSPRCIDRLSSQTAPPPGR